MYYVLYAIEPRWVMNYNMVGLRGVYFEDENLVILETDNVEAVKECEDWH